MEYFLVYCILIQAILCLFFHKKLRGKAYIAPIVPLAIGAGQALFQAFQSGRQRRAANQAEGFIPPGLKEEENIARTQAGATRYAGQDQDEAQVRQGVSDTFSNVSRATTSSGEVLNAASKLSGAQDRAIQGIQRTGQVFRQNAMDRLRGTLARKAGAQMQARMYAENLRGAAARNEYNAVSSLAGGVIQGGMTKDWNTTFGKNTNPSMIFNPMATGMGMPTVLDPNRFSTHGWNPMAFSVGFNRR